MLETPLINPHTHARITNFQKLQIQNHFIPTNQIKNLQTVDARSPHDVAARARARKRVRDFQRREKRGSCAAVSGGGGGGGGDERERTNKKWVKASLHEQQ